TEAAGTDRVLFSTQFNPLSKQACGKDEAAKSFVATNNTAPFFKFNLDSLNHTPVRYAELQCFAEDIQTKSRCSKFSMTINGKNYPEGEALLNDLEMSPGMGKLIHFPLTPDMCEALARDAQFTVKFDERTGAGDAYAIDFIRILGNPFTERMCRFSVKGVVLEEGTEAPLPGAIVSCWGGSQGTTNSKGEFTLDNIPGGVHYLTISRKGYFDSGKSVEVNRMTGEPLSINLKPGKRELLFMGRNIASGENVVCRKTRFVPVKNVLEEGSTDELGYLSNMMKQMPEMELVLEGHSELNGDPFILKQTSWKKAMACKEFIMARGIDGSRIRVYGYGNERPLVKEGKPEELKSNDRIEFRISRL
ncbi:MAG TPA: carboxypeptidase-like regulatory domain-containing protein, partial [Chitinophagaceae bacterium]|nr:carboxypeptidase-like regulatory domain-containing protein [Chitinophagaceae bacterium]